VGDFNGDGIPDLAVVNRGANDLSILLGNGDGSFQAAKDFGAGDSPIGAAVGDFNGDGALDLAVVNLFSDDVSVLINSSKSRTGLRQAPFAARRPMADHAQPAAMNSSN